MKYLQKINPVNVMYLRNNILYSCMKSHESMFVALCAAFVHIGVARGADTPQQLGCKFFQLFPDI